MTTLTAKYKPYNGLYDMIGNVSEMINEKGKQKGGNWDCFINECGVNKTQYYKDNDPRVGFRVFMEIIER